MNRNISVGGVSSLTTIDYPEHLAAVIFLQGCFWRCRYCHNKHLQSILPSETLPWDDVCKLLKTKQGLLECVVFSGGEPLIQEGLSDAIDDVIKLGFKIGLHTSGSEPVRFTKIISRINWVGFDVKCTFRDYHLITGIENSGALAKESLKILLDSKVDYEVRFTLFNLIPVDDVVETLKDIAAMGVKYVVLQKCRDKNQNIIEHEIFSDEILLEKMAEYFETFSIRG